MNYRHAFHAGNHGDVLKHIVLARLIEYLKKKDKGFLLLDAHAGIGAYALDGEEAGKTREWEAGVGRFQDLFARPVAGDGIAALLAPWLSAIRAINPHGQLLRYPGSPEIARQMLRAQDRLALNELHPQDHATLAIRHGGDRRATVSMLDAETAVKAALPPVERRGIVLIDPPYEATNEFTRVLTMLQEGLRRFATGVFMIWYPVVDGAAVSALEKGIAEIASGRALLAEIRLRAVQLQGGLVGSGLIIVNPPYLLDEDLKVILPFLLSRFQTGPGAQTRLNLLNSETPY